MELTLINHTFIKCLLQKIDIYEKVISSRQNSVASEFDLQAAKISRLQGTVNGKRSGGKFLVGLLGTNWLLEESFCYVFES